MLPAERRVRRPEDFSATVRDGRRVGSPALVLHVRTSASDAPARAGFVVPRSVGPAVVRNRVRRRLRHAIRPRLEQLPAGTSIVVRVLPAAATLRRGELETTLAGLVERAAASGARS